MELYTVGHSTRSEAEFLRLLQTHEVQCVADVRAYPGSHRYPHFGTEQLARGLRSAGIRYRHLPLLGGRRHQPPGGSEPSGWRNDSFRAYASYMGSPEFAEGLEELLSMAAECRTAIMCAEAVPWRCHRWLISDALVARGVSVEHILGTGKRRPHALTKWARVEGDRVIYPPEDSQSA